MLPPVPAIYLFALRSNCLSQINISQGPGLGEGGGRFSGGLAHRLLVTFSHWEVLAAGWRVRGREKPGSFQSPRPRPTPLLQGPSPAASPPPCGPDPTGQPLPLGCPLLCSGMYSLPLSLQRLVAAACRCQSLGRLTSGLPPLPSRLLCNSFSILKSYWTTCCETCFLYGLHVQYLVLNVWDFVTLLCNYCYNSANLEITQHF